MQKVSINTEIIKLDQLLKLADVCQTGGHAKFLIQEGLVTVNSEVETRRGKKIVVGDIIEIKDKNIKIQITKEI